MQNHLIPHLMRKDFRHVLFPLSLWALLLLLQAVLIGTGFSSAGYDMQKQLIYTAIALLIPLLQGILVILLVPLVVQDEPLVSSSSHWLTRPLDRRTVLAEKLLFFGAFLVLPPIAVNLLVFAVNGVQTQDMLAAIPQFLMTGFGLVIPLMLLAALTPNFGRYAVILVAVWILMTIVSAVFQFSRFSKDTNDAVMSGVLTDVSLPLSRAIVASAFTIVVGLALIIWQYTTRQTRRAGILAALGLAVVLGLQTFWPINLLESPPKPAAEPAFRDKTVQFTILPETINTSEVMTFNSTDQAKTTIHATLQPSGLPDAFQLIEQRVEAQLILSNGETLKSNTYKVDVGRVWNAPAINGVLNGPKVANAESGDRLRCDIFSLPSKQYHQVQTLTGNFSGKVHMNVFHYSLVGEAPMKAGERIRQRSTQVAVLSVLQQPNGCRVVIRESSVNLWFAGDHAVAPYLSAFLPMGPNYTYVLVNRGRGQAFLRDDTYPGMNLVGSVVAAVSPLVNRTITIDFVKTGGGPNIDEAWLQEATLARIEKIPMGTYTQSVEAANLPLSGPK